jgi:hypothetical protein
MHVTDDALLDDLDALLTAPDSIPVALRGAVDPPLAALDALRATVRAVALRWPRGPVPRRAAGALLDLRGALSQGDRFRAPAQAEALRAHAEPLLCEVRDWLSGGDAHDLDDALGAALQAQDLDDARDDLVAAFDAALRAHAGDALPRSLVAAIWDLRGALGAHLERDDVADLLDDLLDLVAERLGDGLPTTPPRSAPGADRAG